MKRTYTLTAIFLLFVSCAELGSIIQDNAISDAQIASGLKEALEKGINIKVSQLAQKDGFFKNDRVKILFPPELQKVENTLRSIGLSSLADKGVEMLNRAAEEAVKEAIPIFKEAIMQMTFDDARSILMGEQDAATRYLQRTTSSALRTKFSPVIDRSFSKVGAAEIWRQIINKYNSIPFVKKITPDLTGYVTDKALEGVFYMVAQEEKAIRTNIRNRTTDLLRKVFALQDSRQS